MARVRDVRREEISPELHALFDAFSGEYGNFGNQVRVLAHSPEALQHLCGLMVALRRKASLPRRLVEIAVVTVSRLNRCPYCVAHHGPVLAGLGVSAEAIEAILEPAPPGLEPLDLLVRDYARLVIERPWGIRDGVFAALREHFTEPQVVELTLRISLCNLFNQFNEALQVQIEPGVLEGALAHGIAAPAHD